MATQRKGTSQRLYQRAAGARRRAPTLRVAWPLLVGLLLVGVARGEGGARPPIPVAPVVPIVVDQAIEVPMAAPPRLPHLGPRYAAVTLDLFLPVGHKSADINLGLALRRVHEEPDVRLILHPVTNGPLAERGAEVLWEAFEQLPTSCYGFISQLVGHLDWLTATSEGEAALWAGATAAGLDAARLRRALYSHRHRVVVTALWAAVRDKVRYPPELWVNGRSLRGTLTDAQLREEVDIQRTRAQRALQGGAPLTQLYDRLVSEEHTQRPDDGSPALGRPWGRVSLPPLTAMAPLPVGAHLDLSGAPIRGPRIAPVTLTLIGSLDNYGIYATARAAQDAWSRSPDSVRLVFLQAPRSATNRRAALLLTQVALIDQRRFWRLFDSILDILPKSFFLRPQVLEGLIQKEGGLPLIEASLLTPAAESQIKHDLEQARRLGIEYTPVVLVNGQPVRGQPLSEALQTAIERERQRGLLQRLHAPTPRTDAGWRTR